MYQYLFTEGSPLHLESVMDVLSQRVVSLPPSGGEEPQHNVHYVQRLPEAIWGAQLLNNLLLYAWGEWLLEARQRRRRK